MKEKQEFELTSESIVNAFGIKLFRIKSLVKGKYYNKGELGGFVESLNLTNGDARVYGNAWVYGDAQVYGNARVYGNAWVSGDAQVYGTLKIDFVLCSRFNFEFDWQINLWQKKEQEFEEALKR